MSHDNWATPKPLYEELNARFNFDFDPCPLFAKEQGYDGLAVSWGGASFCNPPYNRRDKPKFIAKAYQEYLKGKLVVMLIPVCTSTKQFHKVIKPHSTIEYFEGRISFWENGKEENSKPARQDHMLVIFDGRSVSK